MILLTLPLGLLLALAFVGALHGRLRAAGSIVYAGMAAAAAMLASAGMVVLLGGGPIGVALGAGLPWMPGRLAVDPLSALFLVVVNVGAVPAILFGWGAATSRDGHAGHGAVSGRALAPFPLFLLGMNLTLLADDAFLFLLGWEVMSVASWLLVLADHGSSETRRAAQVYLVMAAAGSAALLVAFGLLCDVGGGYGFDGMRAAGATGLVAGVAAALTILGAGSKAGLIPMHVWLPLAHPAAPSHVSAMMSGVMTKVAVYALVRICFDLLGPPAAWWGAVLMIVGAATVLGGVLYALFQTDIKRLLAYSTVENIGAIAVALGLSLVFQANGAMVPAAVALAAALLHAVNHSLYKTLLFLAAGAVQKATGRRDLGALGGLTARMPRTAAMALVGSLAIAGLPPLNGFVSEWLTFQAVLSGPQSGSWPLKIATMVVGVALALGAALAAACFVRFFGIAFLGRARSSAAAAAVEPSLPILAALVVPASLCILLGLVPALALGPIDTVMQSLIGSGLRGDAGPGAWLWLTPVSSGQGGFGGNSYSGLLTLACLGLLGWLVVLALRRLSPGPARRVPAWGCGHPDVGPTAQYGADSLSQPLRRIFGTTVFAAQERVERPDPGDTGPARLAVALSDPAWDRLFSPAETAIERLAARIDRLRGLTIRRHLALVFTALVVLLIVVAVPR